MILYVRDAILWSLSQRSQFFIDLGSRRWDYSEGVPHQKVVVEGLDNVFGGSESYHFLAIARQEATRAWVINADSGWGALVIPTPRRVRCENMGNDYWVIDPISVFTEVQNVTRVGQLHQMLSVVPAVRRVIQKDGGEFEGSIIPLVEYFLEWLPCESHFQYFRSCSFVECHCSGEIDSFPVNCRGGFKLRELFSMWHI